MLSITMGLLAGGCATGSKQPPPSPTAVPAGYSEASASALVFDLPIDGGMPHPELSRFGREPSAFLGFDQGATEYYTTATDNLQTDMGDFYTQESVSIRTGTRSR